MSASKNRTQWTELPAPVRSEIERLTGGSVRIRADGTPDVVSCTGGFSPGLAVRLRLTDGRLVFVKALDVGEWPDQAEYYRAEAHVAARLPADVPVPEFLGSLDDGRWVILAFEGIDGAEPVQPWRPGDLDRVLVSLGRLAQADPPPLPRDHPRLGGWTTLTEDSLTAGPDADPDGDLAWAAAHLSALTALERKGLAAARGTALVHFDLYSHNILLTRDRVLFVDWPHARLGAAFIDLLTVVSTAPGSDQDGIVASHSLTASLDPFTINAVLAALAGFDLSSAFTEVPASLKPITDAKLRLGLDALHWLRRRTAEFRSGAGTR